jgi:Rod binding domain-containing protein
MNSVSSSVGSAALVSPSQAKDASSLQKIKDNAQAFEGILIRQMLKELRNSPFAETTQNDSKAYIDMADEQLANTLAKNGGFGFGQAMAELMMRQVQTAGLIKTSVSAVKHMVLSAP